MATVIDALTVSLGLDSAQFKKEIADIAAGSDKLKRQLVDSAKNIEEINKRMLDGFAALKREFLGFIAAVVGARSIKELVGNLTDANAALGNFSASSRSSAQDIETWSMAIERMGGNADAAKGVIASLDQTIYNMRYGVAPMTVEMSRLNAEYQKLTGHGFNFNAGGMELAREEAAAAQSMARQGPQARADAQKFLLGSGYDASTANAILSGRGDINVALNAARADAPTPEDIKAAQDFDSAWVSLMQDIKKDFLPMVRELDTLFTGVFNRFDDFIKAHPGLAGSLGDLISGKANDDFKTKFGPGTGVAPLPASGDSWNWGKFFRTLLGIQPAQGAELPSDITGDFISRHGGSGGLASGSLTSEGKEVSRTNPLPVYIVEGNDPNSLLGGPIGAGGRLPDTYQGGDGAPRGMLNRRSRFGMGHDSPVDYGGSSGAGNLTKLIAEAASEAGIDPRIMEGIRAGESGHGSKYDFNPGTADHPELSYGPFQLNRLRGLGVQFERDTGLDLRDPKTIPAQARWVAHYLKRTGDTSPWMGYHGPRDADPRWGDSGYSPNTPTPPPSEQISKGLFTGAPGLPPAHTGIVVDGKQVYPSPTETGGPSALRPSGVGHAMNMGAPLSTMAAMPQVGTTSSTSNAYHVARIDVNVAKPGASADDIARELHGALARAAFVTNANTGYA